MADYLEFIYNVDWDNLPEEVKTQAKRCLLDTLGVAFAASQTDLAKIAARFSINQYGATDTSRSGLIGFEGYCSVLGAALAGGLLIDAFDAHDGHKLTKGHAGATVVPALFAILSSLAHQEIEITGKQALEALVIGYEVALRSGIEMHKITQDYPTSGAWAAIGVAAMGARLLDLNHEQLKHALGIAEYYGPRSPMMRCIDHPTMLKDGAGWGALAGASAIYLAREGFTGAPSTLLDTPNEQDYFQRYEILQQYFKPWPVCRWAQPAVEAVSTLLSENRIVPEEIEQIRIETFHEAVRLGNKKPTSTEEAQYALGFPIAAFMIRGELGASEVLESALNDEKIRRIQKKIVLSENPDHNKAFPQHRYASVKIELNNGQILSKQNVEARGDPHLPLSDHEIRDKFDRLSSSVLNALQQQELKELVYTLEMNNNIKDLLDKVVTRF